MLTAFARAFKTPDLRKKLLFTLGIIVLFRLGRARPDPGRRLRERPDRAWTRPKGNRASSAWSTCSAVARCCRSPIFALGIMPYITASIILQLLTVVIPRLEALKKEGQAGTGEDHAVHPLSDRRARRSSRAPAWSPPRAAARSSSGCPVGGQIVPDQSIFTTVVMVITMTAGTARGHVAR